MTALEIFARFAVFLFVVTTMLSVGLELTISQILLSFRPRLLLSTLVANFVITPLVAYLLTRSMSLAPPLAIGLLLLGSAAGAPFSPKLVQLAKGNVAFAVGITVLLMVLSIGFMPIAVPTLLPLTHVRPWLVAKPLVTVMLPPLVIGLLVKARRASFAERCAPYLRGASTTLLFLTVVLVIASRYQIALRTILPNALVAAVLLLLISFASGFALGGLSPDTRKVVAFATAQRDLSAALLVAIENFADPAVIVMIIVMAILGLCVQIPIALVWGRRMVRH